MEWTSKNGKCKELVGAEGVENIEAKTSPITKKKKNGNWKVGINKNINYTPDKHAPRKVCSKCGSSNHLAIQCKTVDPPIFSPSIPAQVNQNFSGFAKMPFLSNPYYLYENVSMSPMPWGTHQLLITILHIHILKMLAKVILSLKFLLNPKAKDHPLR